MSIEKQNRILKNTHVFVLRIWAELSEVNKQVPEYRISIDHVATQKHYALKDINQLPSFILSFFKGDKEE